MTDLRLATNHATVRQKWNFQQFIEGTVRHGFKAAALWKDKVDEIGVAEAKRILADHDLIITGYNRIGPLVSADAQERRDLITQGKHVIDEAAELGAECVFIFPGGLIPGSKNIADANRQTMEAIEALLPHAIGTGVPLAIEPLHPMIAADRSCINTMRHANDICDHFGEGVGVVVDVYHVWWDDQLEQEIARAGKGRLLGFHICDWLIETKSLLSDRGMPGDGVIDLFNIDKAMTAAGYTGYREVELFSDRWWAEEPDHVFNVAKTRSSTIFTAEKDI